MQNRTAPSDAATRLSASLKARRPGQPGARGAADQRVVDESAIAELLAECARPGQTLIVGVTGSVAAGKTTLCNNLSRALQSTLSVETISTDGFLLPNAVLERRGLLIRKGFPESYDTALMSGKLQRARWGAVQVPGYSHRLYDRMPALDRVIDRPDILLVEGLGLSPGPDGRNFSTLLDILIYIDAAEEDLESWFVRRFLGLWREAETDPVSFYSRFRSMTEDDAEIFARSVWASINLPNLRDHIQLARADADIVLRKAADHTLRWQATARSTSN
jgi:type I pantothenate kinase